VGMVSVFSEVNLVGVVDRGRFRVLVSTISGWYPSRSVYPMEKYSSAPVTSGPW